MVASKGNLQCEVCHLDGFSNKSSLKRHQRFYCKGATVCTDVKQPQQPLTTDVKVVAVSKEEVIVNTAEVPEKSSSTYCVHCCHDFSKTSNVMRHSCTLAPYYSLLLSADTPCPSDNHFMSCVPAEPRLVQGRGRRELS